ncbi:MAG TPA: hypothetical protein VKX16_18115 [Chloroflexota bacterium]|nr:hypothetical protein [Chloroflexota bacterium]
MTGVTYGGAGQAPSGVPAGGTPPTPPPYAPAGGPPSGPHRLPPFALVAAILGAIILLALTAVVVHAIHSSPNPTPVVIATVAPTPAQTNPTPLPTPATTPTVAPTPPSTVQPTPAGVTPTPVVTPGGGGGSVISTNTWNATIPAGWSTVKSDNVSAVLRDGNGNGAIYIEAGHPQSPTTAQSLAQSIESSITKQNPDAATCINSNSVTLGTPPIAGTDFALCYTFTPQNGPAYPAVDEYWVASNTDGTTIYEIELFSSRDKHTALINDAVPLLKSIQWKVS